jgi:hypothetical protein
MDLSAGKVDGFGPEVGGDPGSRKKKLEPRALRCIRQGTRGLVAAVKKK